MEISKKILDGVVRENTKIAENIYKMTIESEEIAEWFKSARAGQFVNIYLGDMSMLLPRPISISEITIEGEDGSRAGGRRKAGRIVIVYKEVGKGTKKLSQFKIGQEIKFSSPLGNGYDISDEAFENESREKKIREVILVAGGVGIPPMVELAKRLKAKGYRVNAFLGFVDEAYLHGELKEICDEIFIATDKGTVGFKGNVVELMAVKKAKADYCFACGPGPMLKALWDYCNKVDMALKVSLEERMGCGYGVCVGCSVNIKQYKNCESNIHINSSEEFEIVRKKVCKDGPVFLGREVVWNE